MPLSLILQSELGASASRFKNNFISTAKRQNHPQRKENSFQTDLEASSDLQTLNTRQWQGEVQVLVMNWLELILNHP
jgi:hypothetical protein